MMRSRHKTDFEKLLFAKTYISELKKELDQQTTIADRARKNLKDLIRDLKEHSPTSNKLIGYRAEIRAVHKIRISQKHEIIRLKNENTLLAIQVQEATES